MPAQNTNTITPDQDAIVRAQLLFERTKAEVPQTNIRDEGSAPAIHFLRLPANSNDHKNHVRLILNRREPPDFIVFFPQLYTDKVRTATYFPSLNSWGESINYRHVMHLPRQHKVKQYEGSVLKSSHPLRNGVRSINQGRYLKLLNPTEFLGDFRNEFKIYNALALQRSLRTIGDNYLRTRRLGSRVCEPFWVVNFKQLAQHHFGVSEEDLRDAPDVPCIMPVHLPWPFYQSFEEWSGESRQPSEDTSQLRSEDQNLMNFHARNFTATLLRAVTALRSLQVIQQNLLEFQSQQLPPETDGFWQELESQCREAFKQQHQGRASTLARDIQTLQNQLNQVVGEYTRLKIIAEGQEDLQLTPNAKRILRNVSTNCQLINGDLFITTRPLKLNNTDREFWVQPLEVKINIRRGSVVFKSALDGVPHNHPHIFPTTSERWTNACLGNISQTLPQLIHSGKLDQALILLVNFLTSHNPNDVVRSLRSLNSSPITGEDIENPNTTRNESQGE